MYSRRVLAVVLATLMAGVCTNACKKSSETERREAERATRHADEKTREADQTAAEKQNEYLASVRREQIDLRGRVQSEIDDVDKKLLDLKVDVTKDASIDTHSKDYNKIQELLQKRRRLEGDMQRIDRSDDRTWEQTKTEIEHDLSAKPGGGKT
jgi:hypothetical protein